MPRLGQIYRKPGQEKPGQRGDAVLAEVDTYQHAVAQQVLDRSPGEQTSLPRAGADQTAALLDDFNLRSRDTGMVPDIVDILDPDQSKNEAQYTHEPKAAPPASGVDNPAQDRGEDHQREILRRVEDRGSPAAFVGGKPGGYDAAISRKDRGLGKSSYQPQKKDHGEGGARGKIAGKAREQGADRPDNDADTVDQLGAKTVEQRAGGQLPEHIGPTEAGEEIAHLHRVERNVLGHRSAGEGKRHPVSIAEAANGEENGNDQVADVGLFGVCHRSLGQGQDRPAMSLVKSCSSASVRPVSGGRTGPAGRPTAFIPAFTMETA